MQKATLFTILLGVMVVLVVADLLANKPFEKSNGNASVLIEDVQADNIQAPSIKQDDAKEESREKSVEDDGVRGKFAEQNNFQDKKNSVEDSQVQPPVNISAFLKSRAFWLESLRAEDLHKIGFQNIKLEKVPFDSIIFQLIDVSPYRNLSSLRMHLTDSKNIFGLLNEFEFPGESPAIAFYADLKQKIGAFSPKVALNETNQYGDNSFFMNDSERAGTAFIVFRLKGHVFAFSYPKASHEFFKTLILLLAKSP